MLIAWMLFPLLALALCLGSGLLVEAASGRRLAGALLAPVGFAAIVVVTTLATTFGPTAGLATPAAVAMAIAGLALARGRRPLRPEPWLLGAAIAVFAVYAAPVVASGEPTFAGYIKLDDTATWLAFVDRLMVHGRDLSGLDPSSYASTLLANLPQGYPVGAFVPLGVGRQLTGVDGAWLVQPYMATLAALLALALAEIARPLVGRGRARALVAFGAAQPALLYGYGLWGGLKELAVAAGLATLAAAIAIAIAAAVGPDGPRGPGRGRAPVGPRAPGGGAGWRSLLPLALASTSLLGMVGPGALVWALPLLGLGALALWRGAGLGTLLRRAGAALVMIAALGLPIVFGAGAFSPLQGGLTSAGELGNLVRPLRLAQVVGIWPSGDFRFGPGGGPLAAGLIALAALAALAAAWKALRRGAWTPLLYLIGAGLGSVAAFLYSSPWVGAKALASGSPAVLLLALCGAVLLGRGGTRVLGVAVGAALLGGVLWSNALGYHDVSLAPYAQLRELQGIGERIAGQGPALLTEYQPYGARHFLRAADGEGVSELRPHAIPLRRGGEAEKGEWVDTDEIELAPLLGYRTLVLRRSPAQSRPPSPYSLRWRGAYYEVWQRPARGGPATVLEHLPLGDLANPGAPAPCGPVRRLGALAGPAGTLAAVPRSPVVWASLGGSRHPPGWEPTGPGSPDLIPREPGQARLRLEVLRPGRYEVYLLGSTRNPLSVDIDGRPIGAVGPQLNPDRQFLRLGTTRLGAGTHRATVRVGAQSAAPGSGGPPLPIGPLILSRDDGEPPVLRLPASRVGALCGRWLDWVEAVVPAAPGSSGSGEAAALAREPRLLNPAQLRHLSARLRQPIFWLGPRPGTRLELSEEANGNLYLRYLTGATAPGDPRSRSAVVGTYPLDGAAAATRRAARRAGRRTIPLAGGGVAFLGRTSAYLAYPGRAQQVEVFSPTPGLASRLVRAGRARPVSG